MQTNVKVLEEIFPEFTVREVNKQARVNVGKINRSQLLGLAKAITDRNVNAVDVNVKRSGTGLVIILD